MAVPPPDVHWVGGGVAARKKPPDLRDYKKRKSQTRGAPAEGETKDQSNSPAAPPDEDASTG